MGNVKVSDGSRINYLPTIGYNSFAILEIGILRKVLVLSECSSVRSLCNADIFSVWKIFSTLHIGKAIFEVELISSLLNLSKISKNS